MKISQTLPQFERYPALFITSGEYEALFYLAYQGELKELKKIKMAPREEAREKQGMLKSSSDASHLGAVSHHGNYVEDLKLRFGRAVHQEIQDVLAAYPIEEICLFAPKYVQSRIMKNLSKEQRVKVRMQFFSEYTKANPVLMLETFWQEVLASMTKKNPPSKEAQKILAHPSHKKTLHGIKTISQLPSGIAI